MFNYLKIQSACLLSPVNITFLNFFQRFKLYFYTCRKISSLHNVYLEILWKKFIIIFNEPCHNKFLHFFVFVHFCLFFIFCMPNLFIANYMEKTKFYTKFNIKKEVFVIYYIELFRVLIPFMKQHIQFIIFE